MNILKRVVRKIGRIVGIGRRGEEYSMKASLRRLSAQIPPPATVIDLGAAEGNWSRFASTIFPKSAFLLCEPLPARGEALKSLVQQKGDAWHFEAAVVGGEAGSIPFSVTDDLDGSGVYGTADAIELPQKTLDEIVSEKKVSGPFLVKFDTHGYEENILSGMPMVLEETDAIIMEVYNFDVSPHALKFWEICSNLEKLGFRVAGLAEPRIRPGDQAFWQMDLVFLRADHEMFLRNSYH